MAVTPEAVLRFPEPVGGLNGSCVVAPGVILIADCLNTDERRLESGANRSHEQVDTVNLAASPG